MKTSSHYLKNPARRIGRWWLRHMPQVLAALAAAAVGWTTAPAAAADPFPSAPIRIVIPSGSGGLNDPIARFLASQFQKEWGQPGIVDHRPGAGGALGTQLVVNAPADGYTLLLGNIGPLVFYPALNAHTTYVVKRDLVPVGSLIRFTNVLSVNNALPVRSLSDLIDLAKKKPGSINFASSGMGQSMHLAGEMFKRSAGINITHVPYKGTAPAITDLIGGHVQMFFGNLPATMPYLQQNQLRPLAVTSARRNPGLPDVPTMEEAGMAGFVIDSWTGLLAPAGTPDAVISRLAAMAEKAWATPEGKALLAANYFEYANESPVEFATFLEKETATWSRFIKEAGIRGE